MINNEKLNKHFEDFQGLVITELNKRSVTELTDTYLDDIFQFSLNKMTESRVEVSISDDFLYHTIKDKVS